MCGRAFSAVSAPLPRCSRAHPPAPRPPPVSLASVQRYDRDQFLFIFLVLTIVAFGTSLQPVRTPLLLNRPQTEEWKGWMQVGGRGREG